MKFPIVCILIIISRIGVVESINTYYMDRLCGATLDMPSLPHTYAVRIKLTENSQYSANLNCKFSVYTEGNEHLMLYFKDMDIENDCSNYYLELHDGPSQSDPFVPGLAGRHCVHSKPAGVHHTNTNILTLYFSSARLVRYNDFDMVITRYHDGACRGNEYKCGNGRCINKRVRCNGYNPCGDYSDCTGLVGGAIAGIVIGCCAFLFFVVICIVLTRRRRRLVYREKLVTVQTPPAYGTSGVGYNQPVPQQYQPPPSAAYQDGNSAPPPYSK